MRHRVRALVHLPIRQLPIPIGKPRFWTASRLRLEQLMNTLLIRIRARGRVPLDQLLPLLFLAQHVELR